MTNILAIDTSSECCSVALGVGDDVREQFERSPMQHAERVLPMVELLMSDAGLTLSHLDAIAFGRGPGSFTGLRIGIGVVQGLAWGVQTPVVPISSLAAVAQSYVDQERSDRQARICVAMDARMQEVYTAQFELDENHLVLPASAERVCPPDLVEIDAPGKTTAVGNGFERYPALTKLASQLHTCEPDCWPHAASIIRLAGRWLDENEALPASMAQPVYLRDKVAEKSVKPSGFYKAP